MLNRLTKRTPPVRSGAELSWLAAPMRASHEPGTRNDAKARDPEDKQRDWR
jgi:hypothetical protein